MNVAAPLVDLWGSVENDIIADIARRLIKNGENTPTAAWQMMKLREMGVLQTDMSKALSKATKRNEKDLYRMIVQACKDALAFDDEMYVKAGYAPIPMTESAALMSVIQSGIRKTSGLMSNFTNTLAADGNKAFSYALDRAWLQVSTGAFTQQQALTMVVEDLSKKGIRGIVYPSGHKDKLDVAARRALITGMNQTVAELQLARMDEMNCDLVEVTSHAGARPTHAVWQGQVYSRRGRTSEYGNFYDETGYGTGEGLCGWNCYHSFYPYFEGLSRRAAERDPAARLGKSNDQVYEESQQQRYFERQIREAKRECVTLDAARGEAKDPLMKQQLDAEFSRASVRLKSREAKLDAFCKETGRTKLSDRASVVGFGRSTSSKATWAAKKAIEADPRASWSLYTTTIAKDTNGRQINVSPTVIGMVDAAMLKVFDACEPLKNHIQQIIYADEPGIGAARYDGKEIRLDKETFSSEEKLNTRFHQLLEEKHTVGTIDPMQIVGHECGHCLESMIAMKRTNLDEARSILSKEILRREKEKMGIEYFLHMGFTTETEKEIYDIIKNEMGERAIHNTSEMAAQAFSLFVFGNGKATHAEHLIKYLLGQLR